MLVIKTRRRAPLNRLLNGASRKNPKPIYSDQGKDSRDSLDRGEGQGIIMISQGGAF